MSAFGVLRRISAIATSIRVMSRQPAITVAPAAANAVAISRPRPRLAPVTSAVFPASDDRSASDQGLDMINPCSAGLRCAQRERSRFRLPTANGWRYRRRYFCRDAQRAKRSEEHTSELQSLMRNSYAVFCLKKKNTQTTVYK